DSRVTDLETTVDKRTVVSLLDYPNIFPYKSTDGAGVGVPGTPEFDINFAYNNDSGPGLQVAMQDAIDRHLVLEFPANQLFYVRTPIVLYVGTDSDLGSQADAINDHQGFVIRGNHSKIWVPQGVGATPAAWSTLNGPLITIMGRDTIAQWNNPTTAGNSFFTSTIRDLDIYLQGHYGEDPHRDMYAQIGDPTGTNATYSDNHLFIEGWKIRRELRNITEGSTLTAEGDGYYNNALVRITNANLLTFENGSVIGGGISLEATSGNVTGSIWIRGNDIRGPAIRKDSGSLGIGLRYAPGIEDAAPNSARAIGLSAETGGQVASVYVHENQIYYAGIGMHIEHGSSIHDVTFTGNEFDIGVDSTPFIHADIEPAPSAYISEGHYYNIHIHNNDLSVPWNAPAFVFEGTDSPAGSGPDWVGAGNPGFDYGYTGLVIQGNHIWSGNAYDPSNVSIDSPAFNDGGVGFSEVGRIV
ncbi:MAG: hypothetical protein EB157_05900, partial [Euryarchaeota archaeon]|nr:hypothetical protein [Euryarchaeota archaeon]